MADYSSPTDEKRPLPSVAGTGASKVENSSVPSSTKAISQPRASSSPFSSPSPPPPEPWFSRIYRYLLYGGIAYVAFLLALTIPVVQRNILYLHNINYPFFADFANPTAYGYAPYKVRNLRIETSDGETLGVWHILPNDYYRSQIASDPFPPTRPLTQDIYDASFKERPTALFLHGNAANRALSLRTHLASLLSTSLDVNVLLPDYRGFGDSSGTPSEQGLIEDALTCWRWIEERRGGKGRAGVGTAIVGQSLGTGVGSGLVKVLAEEGIHPPLLVLLSPFSSLPSLLQTYNLFRIFPILSPLKPIPLAQTFFTSPSILKTQFNSLEALTSIPSYTSGPNSNSSPCEDAPESLNSPLEESERGSSSWGKGPQSTSILLAHALDDTEIPSSHSQTLFQALLSHTLAPSTPSHNSSSSSSSFSSSSPLPLTPTGLSQEAIHAWRVLHSQRLVHEAGIVHTSSLPGWGVLKTFGRASKVGEVVWLEAEKGGHDQLGGSEGVVLLLGELWGL